MRNQNICLAWLLLCVSAPNVLTIAPSRAEDSVSHRASHEAARESEERKKEIGRDESSATRSHEIWHNTDLTNRKETRSPDLSTLDAKLNARAHEKTDAPNNAEQLKRKIGDQEKATTLSRELIYYRREKGNYGIGSGSREVADMVGRAWVGKDATLASDKKTMVSADGLRQYRPPVLKSKMGREQANYERRDEKLRSWSSNGHLDIEE
jgi:hypothetical protein